MLFPLLLSLSQRLAALLSSAMLGLVALVATLLFAKKAFLLSAAALAIAAWDANRRKNNQPAPEIHVHRIPVYHREYYPEHYETHDESYKTDYTAPQENDFTSASHGYGGISQNYGSASQNYDSASHNYGSASQKYSIVDKSQYQQLRPIYGATEKSQQFYGQAIRASNLLPYRSPYRYRKGRG